MKKLTKLLALVLAAVMLLSCGAFAAEGNDESKELWIQWIDWETNELDPQDEPHYQIIDGVLNDELHVAIYASENDGETLTPVPVEKLEADDGIDIYGLCPGEKGKEHYAVIRFKEWDKENTISYNGYSMTAECKLPSIGTYIAPEATVENYLDPWGCMLFSPVGERRTAYIISTDTDANAGRHLVDLAISEDCEDKDSFTLEKVSDDVYKVTCTGGINRSMYDLFLDVTWQHVKFMGGDTWTEGFECVAWENASMLVSEKQVPRYSYYEPTSYYDVADDFVNELTLKVGESKDLYMAFTFFYDDDNDWVMRNVTPYDLLVSDSKLKVTDYLPDDNYADFDLDFYKMTLSCDEPGTYILSINAKYPIVDALYHADGTQYTLDEFNEWNENNYLYVDDGVLVVYVPGSNLEKDLPFEEVYPGEKVLYHMSTDEYWPVTVTVEAAELPFPDVEEGVWYTPAISFAYNKGYMTGYASGNFGPDDKMTGAQFAQLLYNIAGKPDAAEGAEFEGVEGTEWYAPAILWAAGQGIITDTGEEALKLDDPLPRQQMAVMLYNYLGKPAGTADLSGFTDADQVSEWAEAALQWAVSAKVINGKADGTLSPTGSSTRGQVAQLLMNYYG